MADFPFGSLIDGVTGLIGNAQQNKYNRELAEYQNAFNLEMWNRQNEYNSPIETMKRLTEAGINPRNVNGLQTFSNSADAPQAAEYSKTAPLSAFSDIARTAYEFAQYNANLKKTEEEIKTEKSKQTELDARAVSHGKSDESLYRRDELAALEYSLQRAVIEQNLYERGAEFLDVMPFYSEPTLRKDPRSKGIGLRFDIHNNNATYFQTMLRKYEYLFKKYDYDLMKRFGLDNRTQNWIDKIIRAGGRVADGLGKTYFDY